MIGIGESDGWKYALGMQENTSKPTTYSRFMTGCLILKVDFYRPLFLFGLKEQ